MAASPRHSNSSHQSPRTSEQSIPARSLRKRVDGRLGSNAKEIPQYDSDGECRSGHSVSKSSKSDLEKSGRRSSRTAPGTPTRFAFENNPRPALRQTALSPSKKSAVAHAGNPSPKEKSSLTPPTAEGSHVYFEVPDYSFVFNKAREEKKRCGRTAPIIPAPYDFSIGASEASPTDRGEESLRLFNRKRYDIYMPKEVQEQENRKSWRQFAWKLFAGKKDEL
eukprot:TRINITY_DN16362_c0_g1_i1.p1 TRINITY_DN16362_c0_g1~~TRINITY_DN16362_c0_g1_i1.p1  ORF type:complete len:222 (-),score=7.73 TRINITY_DN16362_c0_g1_i1:136-801(-)